MSVFIHLSLLGIGFYFLRDLRAKPTSQSVSLDIKEKLALPTKHITKKTSNSEHATQTPLKSTGEEIKNLAHEAYYLELRKRIRAEERYPSEARKRGITGAIEIEFRLNDFGQIIEIHSKLPGKSAILNEAAIAAVKAASPFSTPPAGISRVFRILIEFKIN